MCLVWPQVKNMVNPFAYEEYRKDKIRQKIEEARTQRVPVKVRGFSIICNVFDQGRANTQISGDLAVLHLLFADALLDKIHYQSKTKILMHQCH